MIPHPCLTTFSMLMTTGSVSLVSVPLHRALVSYLVMDKSQGDDEVRMTTSAPTSRQEFPNRFTDVVPLAEACKCCRLA